MSTINEVAAGRRAALILAAVGNGLAMALVSITASLDREMVVDGARRFGAESAVAGGALFFLAWIGGGRLAVSVRKPRFASLVLGAAGAELALLSAALVGATSSLLFERQLYVFGVGEALVNWIVKPVTWATLIGSAPALALGAAFPRIVRVIRRPRKQGALN